MASGSKPQKEETAEEIMARKRMIMSGTQAGNLMAYEPGTEIMMNRDGSNGFSMGDDLSDQFKWNEKTGDYRSHGGGIMKIGDIPQAQAAAPSGGGRPNPPSKKKPDWRDDVRDPVNMPGPGATTGDIMGDTYDNMMNWQPISSDGQGGVQGMNPLVDPNAWLHQVDPQYQQYNNPGIYVNPGVAGMLNGQPQATQSSNPYSLLG